MEEPKEKDVSTVSVTEPAVTSVERVAGETLRNKELVAVDRDVCNGKDVMVEALGSSHMYVDGVCTRGGDGNGEVGFAGSVELERDVKPSRGGVGKAGEKEPQVQTVFNSEKEMNWNFKTGCGATAEDRCNESTPESSDELNGVADLECVGCLDEAVNLCLRDGSMENNANDKKLSLIEEQPWKGENVDEVVSDSIMMTTESDERNHSHICRQVLEKDVTVVLGEVFSGADKDVGGTKLTADSEPIKICEGQEAEVVVEQENREVSKSTGIQESENSDLSPDKSNVQQDIEVEEEDAVYEQFDSYRSKEMEEELTDTEQPKSMEDKVYKRSGVKPGSSGGFHQATYELSPKNKDELTVSDMVWGKVRSHPWWPGQIFDPSDASEKAMRHYKKDCFLVAYFGDRTFAWNEESQLKPFRTHFSQIEKQSNSESFHNAVNCALEEVSRRVEFGLACSCIPKDIYNKIKFQTVENAGIREESKVKNVMDESSIITLFEPDRLIEYIKALSEFPSVGCDRLELVVAKAQLLAFYRFKGYHCMPEFIYSGVLSDNDGDCLNCLGSTHHAKTSSEASECTTAEWKNDDHVSDDSGILKGQKKGSHKRKHNLKDRMYSHRKEYNMPDLMDGSLESSDGDDWFDGKATGSSVSPSSAKKHKAANYYPDDSATQDRRKTISLAKVSSSTVHHKQSFKIGECISRVASQLTGSSILKLNSERSQKTDGNMSESAEDRSEEFKQHFEEDQKEILDVQTEYSSLDDLLTSLQLAASNPWEEHSFSNVIVSFFSDFRNSIIVGNYLPTEKGCNRRKKSSFAESRGTFEFEDMSDTYWTDRVIQNGSEEKLSQNKKREYQIVVAEEHKPVKVNRRSYSRKRYSDENRTEPVEIPVHRTDEMSPAELIMNFAELDSVPSEAILNKMFKRFGPLKEFETEVDKISSRARVVFKKSSDAEVAFSSAKKFNIFGQTLVNYELSYRPSAFFKASSVTTAADQEMHLDLSTF